MVRRRSTVRFRKGARRSEACSHAQPQTCFPAGGNTGGSFGASGYSLPVAEVAEEVRAGFRERCSELTSLIR
jgi:hypothetical protein